MEKPLVVTYEGIEIAYIEGSNDWRFELRGRSRRAESLSKAKEFIDKEPSKKKPFEPFSALVVTRYDNGDFRQVQVTSCAGPSRYKGAELEWWISDNGRREKKAGSDLIEDCLDARNQLLTIAEMRKQEMAFALKVQEGIDSLPRIKTPEGTDVS